jgi:parallel beta-helix repeat protein
MIKKSPILVVMFLLLIMSFSGCLQTPSNNNHTPNGTKVYVGPNPSDDFHSIQNAVNAAENGSTIYVREGSYYETLIINKSINLISLEKNKSSIMGPNNASSSSSFTIIQIEADNCSIDGFIITRNGIAIADGIGINSSNNKITNNTITQVTEGLIIQKNTQHNTITGNTITNNHYGIHAEQASYNTYANNTITSNTLYGIYNNYDSNENIFSNNLFSQDNYALRIKGSQKNTVYNNCFINNTWGVYFCCGAADNTAYHNVFKLSKSANIHEDQNLQNHFNITHEGGNYYDNYNGTDLNNDGFGDTPYIVEGSSRTDTKPLMNPPDLTFCKDN